MLIYQLKDIKRKVNHIEYTVNRVGTKSIFCMDCGYILGQNKLYLIKSTFVDKHILCPQCGIDQLQKDQIKNKQLALKLFTENNTINNLIITLNGQV